MIFYLSTETSTNQEENQNPYVKSIFYQAISQKEVNNLTTIQDLQKSERHSMGLKIPEYLNSAQIQH